jgi:hypothetical protein
MSTIDLLGSAMGLGLLAGIRLYATVFFLGLAIRFEWFELTPGLSHLSVLAETPVLLLSGAAFVVEFLADKIPWIDSLWDSVHTFIRPVGAAALAVTTLGTFDPMTTVMLALLSGGIAFTGHTSKAATRLAVNHSPEPFSNWALSLAEDLAVPAGLWIVFQYPAVAIGIASVFILVFLWLSPKVFRLLKVSWVALKSLFRRWFSTAPALAAPRVPKALSQVSDLPFQAVPDAISRKLGGVRAGVHCAATRSVRGLNNSTGYLCVMPDQLVFVARRMFRLRTFQIPINEIRGVQMTPRILVDRLFVQARDKDYAFDVFKAPKLARTTSVLART